MPEQPLTLPSLDIKSQGYTDQYTQNAERQMAPSFRGQLQALREGYSRRGLTNSGVSAQGELGLRQDALGRLAQAAQQGSLQRYGAMNNANEAQRDRDFQNQQFQAQIDFQNEQDQLAQEQASKGAFSNMLGTGLGAVGSIVGSFFGAGDAGGSLGSTVGSTIGSAGQ